jgi:hypothetical protein
LGAISGLEDHLKVAGAFYGPAIDLSKVRVKGSWLVLGGATAWTCNNVIRFKNAKGADDIGLSVFIHELGHVWEHQSGQAQVLKGLVEQLGRRLGGRDPYDYGGPEGVKRGRRLVEFSKESQAQILQEYWNSLHGDASDRRGIPFTPQYVQDLRRLAEEAGIGSTPPRGRELAGWVDTAAGSLVNAVLALLRW